ncbi:Amidohydrolase-related [uncultured Caudovirales phage]|uniref:Amidohydrolase-related n=1 Tax=uncultured Caudovirales phage TaxID=2100421 RepID=A0A6J5TA22_9CAUD|nr:Amidohydrolase-related [uncultured Caudovirales phage]
MKKTALILALLSSSAFAQYSTESVELSKTIPIADVHMHVHNTSRTPSPSDFKYLMEKNNIQWGGGVGDYQSYLADALGNRYISAMGQDEFISAKRESTLTDPEHFKAMFAQAEEMFKAGTLKGFGEIHSDNHTSGHPSIRRQIRIRTPAIEKMYEIANRYGAYVQVHAQYDAQFDEDLYYMSRTYPKVLTVMAHCLPKGNPQVLDRFFTDLPNVVCEISGKNGPVHAGPFEPFESGRIFGKDGVREEWINLIKKHPDRVMLGTDPCCGLESRYSEMIDNMRTMFLPYFEPAVVEKLAYKNAVRLFKLDGPRQ